MEECGKLFLEKTGNCRDEIRPGQSRWWIEVAQQIGDLIFEG
ncbi:MAG TPA: hypothetical protein VLX29_03295 [Nitrospirota bacterium]|nr:hypothetical protein [Nitrospirota bacterium]